MGDSDSNDSAILHTKKRKNVSRLLTFSDESNSDNSDLLLEEHLYSENESEEDVYSSSESEDDSYGDGGSEEKDRSQWDAQENVRTPFDFCGKSGQQFDVPRSSREKCLFYFDKFLDNELISTIVEQTNLYAIQYIESHCLKKRSRMKNWCPTNNAEIKCFMAMLILQGIVRKPTLQMYFCKRESISTPFFSKVLPQERFLLLCKFIHFKDDRNVTSGSKISKIENIMKNIQYKCKNLYIPTQDIYIDECLLLWKGRLSCKQYIPFKRSSFGMKFYVLCESQSGYIWNFCVYTGKNTDYGKNYSQYKTATRIVLELCHGLLGQGYRVYLNNWYTSIELAQKLCTCKTDIIGTMRQQRLDVPSDIKTTLLKKGQYIARYNNKIMLLKWRDKRDVLLLSTIHSTNMMKKEKRDVVTMKPEVVLDYAEKMGDVNRNGGIIASYTLARKRLKKYYKKIFLHLIDIICLNSYILYKKNNGKLNRLNFLLECIERIVEEYAIQQTETSRVGRRNKSAKPTRLIGKHFPNFIPSTSSKANPMRRCAVCSKNGIRKESRYWCSTCEVPLCVVSCFEKYHTARID